MKSILMMLKGIGLYIFFAVLITYSWKWYEIKTFGEAQPDLFHTIVAMILALSLMLNVLLISIFKDWIKM